MYRVEVEKYLHLNIGNACLMLQEFSGGDWREAPDDKYSEFNYFSMRLIF